MAEPTIQLGGGNWAGKSDNLLGYYKEGERFYKQDFTFSRSTTGTYTDSDGYIQDMPYNILQQSNDFDTTWTKDNTTLTSGQSGYDGSSDAIQMEYATLNPWANIKRKAAPQRKMVWSHGEVIKFLDTAYSDFEYRSLGLIVHMAYEWCQRLGDMRTLRS